MLPNNNILIRLVSLILFKRAVSMSILQHHMIASYQEAEQVNQTPRISVFEKQAFLLVSEL